jgi:hypothetical protein
MRLHRMPLARSCRRRPGLLLGPPTLRTTLRAVPTLTRLVYVAACTLLYVLAVFVLAMLQFVGWWLFMIFVLHGLGCDGPCNGIGRFSQDYGLLIVFLLTVLAGLLLLHPMDPPDRSEPGHTPGAPWKRERPGEVRLPALRVIPAFDPCEPSAFALATRE